MATVRGLTQKKVELGKHDFLLLDTTEERGVPEVRVAHYFLRPPPGVYGHLEASPPQQVFDDLKLKGVFKPAAKREAWVRVATIRETLEDALFVIFKEHPRAEYQTVSWYVRQTGWGAELP